MQRILSRFLAVMVILVLSTELLAVEWPAPIVLLALVIAASVLILFGYRAPFWRRLSWWSAFLALLYVASFLYLTRELPYAKRPFGSIAGNAVIPLNIDEFSQVPVTGLPLTQMGTEGDASEVTVAEPVPSRPRIDGSHVEWTQLTPLMQKDSELRDRLLALKAKQEKALSEERARLNSLSVADTGMRRQGLAPAVIEDLHRAHALASAKYKTLRETWQLLDADEKRFREQQSDELFHALTGLLENSKVNEADKVQLIDFMAERFGGDARLVQPLIHLYDRLDVEYPRQRRLNREFLDLYLAKREAVLRGLAALGEIARQPLLDFRRKRVSDITYSQARLDVFLKETYGVSTRLLYGVAPPQFVPTFLNRQKYPRFGRFSGPGYAQEYARTTLLQLAAADRVPEAGQILLELNQARFTDVREAVLSGYSPAIDVFAIDPDPAVRANLAWQLAVVKRVALVPVALDLMHDPNPEVRRLAAIGIGNYRILDTQGANDQAFIESVKLLQNYRSNSDTFSRGWAVLALANSGDKEKALYVIDLLLNDGSASSARLGDAAPTWRGEEERMAIVGLINVLKESPENGYVKTQALNALVALDSPRSLGVLLHHLNNAYASAHTEPDLWRTLVPHMTLPQAAENVEDVIYYLATRQGMNNPSYQERSLEALRLHLQRSYEEQHSGRFFQLLQFLHAFDEAAYNDYLSRNLEHIRYMRVLEFFRATGRPALVLLPLGLVLLFVAAKVLPTRGKSTGKGPVGTSKRSANPAAVHTSRPVVPPPAAILPISASRR